MAWQERCHQAIPVVGAGQSPDSISLHFEPAAGHPTIPAPSAACSCPCPVLGSTYQQELISRSASTPLLGPRMPRAAFLSPPVLPSAPTRACPFLGDLSQPAASLPPGQGDLTSTVLLNAAACSTSPGGPGKFPPCDQGPAPPPTAHQTKQAWEPSPILPYCQAQDQTRSRYSQQPSTLSIHH